MRLFYASTIPWTKQRPRSLVVACSDGRFQRQVDEFLGATQGIAQYDRMYLPGGPGALSTSSGEALRAHECRRSLVFLMESHGIADVILLFHGPASSGPPETVCGDYRRKFPRLTPEEIANVQLQDARSISSWNSALRLNVNLRAIRCEVTEHERVRFHEMGLDE